MKIMEMNIYNILKFQYTRKVRNIFIKIHNFISKKKSNYIN